MRQAAEDVSVLTTDEATRRLEISRMALRRVARRGTIIPVMRTPGGFASVAHANAAAYCFLRRVTLQRPIPTGTDAGGLSGRHVTQSSLILHYAVRSRSGRGGISAEGGC